MLQPDAFCEHTMQQNETAAAGALPRTPLEELTALPRVPMLVLRGAAGRGEGKREEGKGKRGEEQGRRGRGEKGRLTLMRSWNRAADWLRPVLHIGHYNRSPDLFFYYALSHKNINTDAGPYLCEILTFFTRTLSKIFAIK